MKKIRYSRDLGMRQDEKVWYVLAGVLLLTTNVSLAAWTPFVGTGTLGPASNMTVALPTAYGGSTVTTDLSGSFTFAVAEQTWDDPVVTMAITGLNYTGTPVTIELPEEWGGGTINTGDVLLNFEASIPSVGTWNLDTGDVDEVLFPLNVNFANAEFVDLLNAIGAPPPYSAGIMHTGLYTGDIPSDFGEVIWGTISLTGHWEAPSSGQYSPLYIDVDVDIVIEDSPVKITGIPEPTTVLLLGLGGFVLLRRRKG